MELWQLRQRQSLPLEIKIIMSQIRIRQWYEAWDGDVYVSFSGGKDSTVLLHLVRQLYPHVPAVFVDTGLEYPEIREFVKSVDNVVCLWPKMGFKAVLEKYGYPVVSKEQAAYIERLRSHRNDQRLINKYLNGIDYDGRKTRFKISAKWQYLVDRAPFKISAQCCGAMKKGPIKKFEKNAKLMPFIGTMADEGERREQNYLKDGCNGFHLKRPHSRPLSFWTEQDIWDYLKTYNVPYSTIYDMGYSRTGCMFCMFGVHLEGGVNRFQRMKHTHPKQWEYCMFKLGLAKVLDYIHVEWGGQMELDLAVD